MGILYIQQKQQAQVLPLYATDCEHYVTNTCVQRVGWDSFYLVILKDHLEAQCLTKTEAFIKIVWK